MSTSPADGTLDLFSQPEESAESASPSVPVWSVSELNAALRSLLEDRFPEVRVSGEVGGWTRARSGHCYFTLKDDRSQLRCVMWRRDASRLPMDPEEGMALQVSGRVTMYEARGELQLQVRELDAEGTEGLWKLAFERLRRTLQEEGLLAPERKRPLPRFPRAVGVVTSPTGAAIRDILSVIRRRAPWTRVVIRAARVQGEGAAQEVAEALRTLAAAGGVDVVIVGRGGGSLEDLWAFNEEPVARAIAAAPVPVISAVGHETDVTISDLVADLRAPTPSAAAEAAVQDRGTLLEVLDRVRPRLARGLRGQVDRRRHRVEAGGRRMEAGLRSLLAPRRSALERRSHRILPAMRALVQQRRERLAVASGRVEALSPLSTLKRGYAVALDPEGRVLRGVGGFRAGTRFDLRLVDGRIECKVLDIEPDGARE